MSAPDFNVFDFTISGERQWCWIFMAILLGALWLAANLVDSRPERALRARSGCFSFSLSMFQPIWRSMRQRLSGCLCRSADCPGLNGGSKSRPSIERIGESAPSQAISHSASSE